VRQQKREEEGVKCFRYWGVGHHKWEYPNIEVERRREKKKKVACMARPQKA